MLGFRSQDCSSLREVSIGEENKENHLAFVHVGLVRRLHVRDLRGRL